MSGGDGTPAPVVCVLSHTILLPTPKTHFWKGICGSSTSGSLPSVFQTHHHPYLQSRDYEFQLAGKNAALRSIAIDREGSFAISSLPDTVHQKLFFEALMNTLERSFTSAGALRMQSTFLLTSHFTRSSWTEADQLTDSNGAESALPAVSANIFSAGPNVVLRFKLSSSNYRLLRPSDFLDIPVYLCPSGIAGRMQRPAPSNPTIFKDAVDPAVWIDLFAYPKDFTDHAASNGSSSSSSSSSSKLLPHTARVSIDGDQYFTDYPTAFMVTPCRQPAGGGQLERHWAWFAGWSWVDNLLGSTTLWGRPPVADAATDPAAKADAWRVFEASRQLVDMALQDNGAIEQLLVKKRKELEEKKKKDAEEAARLAEASAAKTLELPTDDQPLPIATAAAGAVLSVEPTESDDVFADIDMGVAPGRPSDDLDLELENVDDDDLDNYFGGPTNSAPTPAAAANGPLSVGPTYAGGGSSMSPWAIPPTPGGVATGLTASASPAPFTPAYTTPHVLNASISPAPGTPCPTFAVYASGSEEPPSAAHSSLPPLTSPVPSSLTLPRLSDLPSAAAAAAAAVAVPVAALPVVIRAPFQVQLLPGPSAAAAAGDAEAGGRTPNDDYNDDDNNDARMPAGWRPVPLDYRLVWPQPLRDGDGLSSTPVEAPKYGRGGRFTYTQVFTRKRLLAAAAAASASKRRKTGRDAAPPAAFATAAVTGVAAANGLARRNGAAAPSPPSSPSSSSSSVSGGASDEDDESDGDGDSGRAAAAAATAAATAVASRRPLLLPSLLLGVASFGCRLDALVQPLQRHHPTPTHTRHAFGLGAASFSTAAWSTTTTAWVSLQPRPPLSPDAAPVVDDLAVALMVDGCTLGRDYRWLELQYGGGAAGDGAGGGNCVSPLLEYATLVRVAALVGQALAPGGRQPPPLAEAGEPQPQPNASANTPASAQGIKSLATVQQFFDAQ
ncbi:hypothetical protein HK405_007784, partial [Cladochytrium tenue]